jgi:hypothetical protein
VSLTADDVLLRIGSVAASNTYGFDCPECGEFVEKAADERIVRLLLSGGVMPVLNSVPAEALETHDGPPVSYDDLLAFHELLKSESWFEEVQRLNS